MGNSSASSRRTGFLRLADVVSRLLRRVERFGRCEVVTEMSELDKPGFVRCMGVASYVARTRDGSSREYRCCVEHADMALQAGAVVVSRSGDTIRLDPAGDLLVEAP